ncbi:fibronectin type III domain-containing protein [Aquimarina algicola]|uniref:Fibronectin type-III domain-containing protein n=1 Tax=Aquimarina algicola TaxID=2589995 RepID=A0A504JMN7_9FLAO|nr:hypothetical protein [Aquimarina algicola]TPN87680.1 hypothetical protein FHK87_08880 [Aquimarina algicola]
MKKILYIGLFFLTLISCEEVFFEEDLEEEMINLLAPIDEAIVRNTAVTFSWEPVDQATEYLLQVAQPNFENATQIVLDTTVTSVSFTSNLIKNEYEWRIRAQNSGSSTPYATAKFTVLENEEFSARQVVLTAPENNALNNTNETILQWQNVTDATSYKIQLLNSSNEVVQEETTTDTSITITFPEGVTQWQVRAENNTQNTFYSTRTITIDSEAPKQPVNSAPANDATLTETTVNFSWTRETVAGTAEFDSIFIYKDVGLTQLATKDRVTSPSEIALETSTTYYWFIKAFDEAGNESESGTVSRFTIN